MKKILIGTAGTVLITGFAVQEKAVAVGVNVLNSGFESPTAPYNPVDGYYYTVNAVTSWQVNPNSGSAIGVYNPNASTASNGSHPFNQPIPEGSQVAYNNGGTLSQQLSTNLAPNTTYNLSTFVGRRNDVSFPGYNVVLLAGNTVLASNNSVVIGAGTFSPVNVTYTSGSSDAVIGQPLTIDLVANSGGQVEFDNVTLDAQTATPVPFEFSPGLGILALGALGGIAQLRSQVQKWKLKT